MDLEEPQKFALAGIAQSAHKLRLRCTKFGILAELVRHLSRGVRSDTFHF